MDILINAIVVAPQFWLRLRPSGVSFGAVTRHLAVNSCTHPYIRFCHFLYHGTLEHVLVGIHHEEQA